MARVSDADIAAWVFDGQDSELQGQAQWLSKLSGKIPPVDAYLLLRVLRDDKDFTSLVVDPLNSALTHFKLRYADELSRYKDSIAKHIADAKAEEERIRAASRARMQAMADEKIRVFKAAQTLHRLSNSKIVNDARDEILTALDNISWNGSKSLGPNEAVLVRYFTEYHELPLEYSGWFTKSWKVPLPKMSGVGDIRRLIAIQDENERWLQLHVVMEYIDMLDRTPEIDKLMEEFSHAVGYTSDIMKMSRDLGSLSRTYGNLSKVPEYAIASSINFY